MHLRISAALAATIALASCVGGGNDPVRLVSQLDYQNTAYTRHSYTPYQTGSHIHGWDGTNEIHIGGDIEPKERLRHVLTDNGIEYYMGSSRDGVGVDRLQDYERDLISRGGGFYPFLSSPVMYFDPDLLEEENRGISNAVFEGVLILNDALPPEFQIRFPGPNDIGSAFGGIRVELETRASIASICGAQAVACADSVLNASTLYLPDDFDTSESYPRKVIVHELLHALGIGGHVDSVEFPDSIMGTSGEHIPNLGYTISKIDREVLQIMYMNQRTDLYNDWGEWSDTAHHLMGRSPNEELNFGVALFNGLPQPWVRGAFPSTHLANNPGLFGTATWNGSLLGFSGSSPIAGDASLQVSLNTLTNPNAEHDLRFRDIYFLNRYESADPWFSTRNVDYRVSVSGNFFSNVRGERYEQGHVVGSFLGRNHEHMGGTVKRTDMVGAFGGSR